MTKAQAYKIKANEPKRNGAVDDVTDTTKQKKISLLMAWHEIPKAIFQF